MRTRAGQRAQTPAGAPRAEHGALDARARGHARAMRVLGVRGRVHTCRTRKIHHLSHHFMIGIDDWLPIRNIKHILLESCNHGVISFFKQRCDEFLHLVAVLLRSLVLSLLKVLQEVKISFHVRCLQFQVLLVC